MIKENSRECTVCVTSEQRGIDGETQIFETKSRGRLSEKERALYVLYEEIVEELQEKTASMPEMTVKNLLKIEEEPLRVSLKKSGAVSWKITFEQGKREVSEYGTPCGMLQIGADTKRITLKKEQKKTSLLLLYTLLIQGEKQADCRLEIEIL